MSVCLNVCLNVCLRGVSFGFKCYFSSRYKIHGGNTLLLYTLPRNLLLFSMKLLEKKVYSGWGADCGSNEAGMAVQFNI